MTDDWQWFWAGESGRDSILRDEVEGLHARLSSASAHTSRLSSQLASLSGSLETRLNALSKAFDAYVELGDVREELAGYEESAAVRRDVLATIAALAGGRPADAVDPRGLDYWLPYATDAVIGFVEGRREDADLERARAVGQESDLFVVAACGALGHGPAVAGLLPAVLTGDQALSAHQRAVWRGVTRGIYGELAGDLADALSRVWLPLLDREPVPGWSAWVHSHAPSPSAGVSWLRTLVTDPTALRAEIRSSSGDRLFRGFAPRTDEGAADAGPSGDPRDGLRAVVSELIGRGMPTESGLLARARELRALIEEPERRPAAAAPVEPITVVSEVRRALLSPSTTPAARTTLLAWVAPALLQVLDALTAAAHNAPPAQQSLRTSGGVIDVTPSGADQAAVAAGVSRLEAAYEVSNRQLVGWSVAAAVAAVLTLVLGVAGSGWAWLTGVALVAGVIGALRQVSVRRTTARSGVEAIDRLRRDVADATAEVTAAERQRTSLLVGLTAEAAEVRARLTSAARPRISSAGDR